MLPDPDRIWRAVQAGDARFDGWVFCGVVSTGVYCRPSCPARTPKRENMRWFATAAAAQAAGFRACKRCRPDATPGSPEWDRRADLVGRAMRLIADGVVDREGVAGLAHRLGYSERHVHRELVRAVGVGAVALARAQRAQTARLLLETTSARIAEVALASGFRSVRQFNATIREVYAATPGELRARGASAGAVATPGTIELRLPFRAPLHGEGLIAYLAGRAVPGIEWAGDGSYCRSLRLPHGAGAVELSFAAGHVLAALSLEDLRDLGAAIQRCRALLDLDSDPHAVVEALGGDRRLGPLVRACPGRRVAGAADGEELAVRALLGQQVSLRAASALAGWLVARHGRKLLRPRGAVTHLFPSAAELAGADLDGLPVPRARRRALRLLVEAMVDGRLALDGGMARDEARARLAAMLGVGPWTVEYVAMRALRDPDAFPAADAGVRRALRRFGIEASAAAATAAAEAWRPYRAYAVQHLWAWAAVAKDAGGAGAGAGPQSLASARRPALAA